MSKKIVLGNHMVPEILAHLNKLTPLPSAGILAGQALCSAILDLYGEGGGVYNDIDIFLPADADKLEYLDSEAYLKEESLRLGLPVAELDEYKCLTVGTGEGLNIAGCEQEGLINIVWCNTVERELLPGTLVYSFDLNAVEVALDLAHNELTWSRGFEEFLQRRELEVTSLATPERTLLRYLKKRSEMPNVFGKDELVKQMAATWMRGELLDYEPKLLTTKSKELVARFQSELAGVFEFKEEDGTLEVSMDWDNSVELEEAVSLKLGDYDMAGMVRVVPALWYAQKRSYSEDATGFAAELSEFFTERDDSGCGIWESVMHTMSDLFGGAYVQGLRSETHRDTVLRTLEKHDGLNAALMGLTLDEQYRCVLDLAKRAKAEAGAQVYGLAETMATPVDMWNQHHRDQFFRQMKRDQMSGGDLRKPVFTVYECDGWTIKELTQASQLRVEGAELGHCVGGYAKAVKSGISRILSVRHADNRNLYSTVELRGKTLPGETVEVSQHRSHKNAVPATETKNVLLSYLKAESNRLGFTLKEPSKKPFSELLAGADLFF